MKKNLKILTIIAMSFLLLTTMTGCTSKEQNIEGSLESIMEKLYEEIPADNKPMLENITITNDNITNYLGTTDIPYTEALVSEPMISSIAHSVVLVRVKDDANIEEVKETIKKNINPRKWICVWVEDKDVIIKNKGNLVVAILVENAENREIISNNFDNLK